MNFTWQRLLDEYQLGRLLSHPQPVTGGLLHQLYRLETTAGLFAAKILNPELVTAWTVNHWQQTEQIAWALAKHGLPAVHGLPSTQGIITVLNQTHVLLFPWIKGEVLNSSDVKQSHAHCVGQLLAKIHHAQLPVYGLPQPSWQGYTVTHWQILAHEAAHHQLPWATSFVAALPALQEWSEQAAAAMPALNQTLVVSHRDFDPKNIIWQNAVTPILIDWEYAGLINPGMDLLGVALNWSAPVGEKANQALFLAVLQGYQATRGFLPRIDRLSIMGHLGYCLEWLEFNVQRALQQPTVRPLANREISKSLRALHVIAAQSATLLQWTNEVLVKEVAQHAS